VNLARVHPVGTAGQPMAAKVHVTLAQYVFAAEATDHLGGVIIQDVVVVPGPLVSVHEDADIGERVVVVDYVGEIDHSLDSLDYVMRTKARKLTTSCPRFMGGCKGACGSSAT